MKYLAILKDSFREAIDFKIFYVMIGLALLVIILVASLSYDTVSPKDFFSETVDGHSFRMVRSERGRHHFTQSHFDLTNIEAITEDGKPQERDYALTLRVADQNPFGFWRAVEWWSKDNMDAGKQGEAEKDPEKPKHETVEKFFVHHFRSRGIDIASVKLKSETVPVRDKQAGSFEYVMQTKGNSDARDWPRRFGLLFGLIQLPWNTSTGMLVFVIEAVIVGWAGSIAALIIAVIVTAFFIPNMMHKGSVDVLICKPIHRATLLIFKYLGGLTFIFLTTSFTFGGVWIVLGLRLGVWGPGFLLSIVILTFFFAVLYAISTFFAVLTRSGVAAMLLTVFLWFLFWIVGVIHGTLDTLDRMSRTEISPGVLATTQTLKDIAPTVNLGELNSRVIANSVLSERELEPMMANTPAFDYVKSILVPCIWIAVMLGLACWRFGTRDL